TKGWKVQEREVLERESSATAHDPRDQRIQDLDTTLAERVEEAKRQAREQRDELSTQQSEQLREARTVEQSLRAQLKGSQGQVLAEDVVYPPTGERIAMQGEVADDVALGKLERIAQEHRD